MTGLERALEPLLRGVDPDESNGRQRPAMSQARGAGWRLPRPRRPLPREPGTSRARARAAPRPRARANRDTRVPARSARHSTASRRRAHSEADARRTQQPGRARTPVRQVRSARCGASWSSLALGLAFAPGDGLSRRALCRSRRSAPQGSRRRGGPRRSRRRRSCRSPVRAGDAEEHAGPAPEPEVALADELALEEERSAHDLVVGALLLRDAVDEDLEGPARPKRAGRCAFSSPPPIRCQRVRRKALVLSIVGAGALALAGAALAGNGGTLPPAPHSPNADSIRQALLLRARLRRDRLRRRRGRAGRAASPATGAASGRATPTACRSTARPASRSSGRSSPVLILAAIAAFVFIKLPSIADAPKASAADSTTITVEGHQFYWLFRYPNGAISVGTMIAPADNVVNEDVHAPDKDVLHSWWVPGARRQDRRDPGPDEPHLVQGGRRRVSRALLRPLRDPAHPDAATVNVVPRDQYESFIKERAANPDSIALGKEEWDHVCAVCHKLDEPYVGPSLGSNPIVTSAKDLDRHPPERRRQDAGGRQQLDGRPDRRAREVHEDHRQAAERQWRLTPTPDPGLPRRLAPRPRHLVADDRRPQADRDPLPLDGADLLRARRAPGAADPGAARDAERDLPRPPALQRGGHDPRDDDDLPRHRPDPRRVRELPRAADDRRARHGLPAAERALLLVLPARRA